MHNLKILYGYSWFPSDAYSCVKKQNEEYIKELNKNGFDVEGFCLTINPPGPYLSFKELDLRWKRGEKKLLKVYEDLQKAIDGKDVLFNSSGINLHPEFVQSLPVFSVYQCFDDPESSEHLSRPVASAYDLCLVGNAAEVETYRSWGVRKAEWTPMGLQSTKDYNTSLTYEDILYGRREIDLFMMIDKTYKWRTERLNCLEKAFPDAHFYGKGWKRGILPSDDQLKFLNNAKIGPNVHNSTGPINFRTFYLPANGVLQICDNKSHLGNVFELKKEVVGFDTIEECIDLCRYYLAHDEERRIIAANGWKRAISDYNMISVFRRNVNLIEKAIHSANSEKSSLNLVNYRRITRVKRLSYYLQQPFSFTQRIIRFIKRKLLR